MRASWIGDQTNSNHAISCRHRSPPHTEKCLLERQGRAKDLLALSLSECQFYKKRSRCQVQTFKIASYSIVKQALTRCVLMTLHSRNDKPKCTPHCPRSEQDRLCFMILITDCNHRRRAHAGRPPRGFLQVMHGWTHLSENSTAHRVRTPPITYEVKKQHIEVLAGDNSTRRILLDETRRNLTILGVVRVEGGHGSNSASISGAPHDGRMMLWPLCEKSVKMRFRETTRSKSSTSLKILSSQRTTRSSPRQRCYERFLPPCEKLSVTSPIETRRCLDWI